MNEQAAANFPALIDEATARALACGALQPIETTAELIADSGAAFIIRTAVSAFAPRKQDLSRSERQHSNPFLPYHPAVFVAFLSRTHVCLLNKFSVVPGHILLVTREFQPQDSLLNLDDFHAFHEGLLRIDGVGFYNSGPLAGASQPHKHLQLVPLPLAPELVADGGPRDEPLAPLWESLPGAAGEIDSCPQLPFQHRIVRLLAGADAHAISALYQQMLLELNLWPADASDEAARGAYNLVITRRWLLVVPRQRDSFNQISLNGLAYAGAILVRGEQQRTAILSAGPMTALAHCAFD